MSAGCHQVDELAPERPEGAPLIALAGNPNVGKSTLFNALTGLGVSTAHYPGTTRDVAIGTTRVGERLLGVIDLPGTYALSGAAEEDVVARRALEDLSPDVVVVLVDPSTVARNLYLALEILDLGVPVVVAANLADEARRAGVRLDTVSMSDSLGVAVVSTVATQGIGVEDLMNAAIASAGEPVQVTHQYSADFEALVGPLIEACGRASGQPCGMSCRGTALALVEGREAVVAQVGPELRHTAETVRTALRGHFDEDPGIRLARERHELAATIAKASIVRSAERRRLLPRDAWALTTWPWTGVPLVALVAGSIFGFLFFVGELLAGAFASVWGAYASPAITAVVTSVAGDGLMSRVLLWGFDAGIEASLSIGIPYILTFYFLLGLLEDTGYLNSLAFLMDRVMHRLGLHGRAIVPFVAAAGCNVPALIAAGQLPTKRERFIASTLVLFVPCSARTAVILGAVGHYVGWQPALAVFAILFVVWLGVGLLLEKMVPGESRGLVMEMFGFRRPSIRRVAQKAWEQFREFLFVATPIVVVGSLVLGGLYETAWLHSLSGPLAPVVEGWLGLPAIAGLTLIVGMLRKELALQLLIALSVATAGVAAAGLAGIMSQTDIVVYALVNAIALPCVSSLAVFWRRHGMGRTVLVVLVGVIVAVVMGGTVARVLPLLGFDA